MNETTRRGTSAVRRLHLRARVVSAVRRGRAHRDDPGATSVEYALMVSLIALAIIASVIVFGQNMIHLFEVPSSAFTH